jgi:vacuolar-type H+-ATPase subunit H
LEKIRKEVENQKNILTSDQNKLSALRIERDNLVVEAENEAHNIISNAKIEAEKICTQIAKDAKIIKKESLQIRNNAEMIAKDVVQKAGSEAETITNKAKSEAQNIRDGITETADSFSLIHHVEAFLYRLSEFDTLPTDQLVKIQELHLKLGQTINAEVQFDVTQSTDVEHIAHQADKQELIALYLNKKIKAIEANENMHEDVKEELKNSLISSLESELKKMSGLDKMD